MMEIFKEMWDELPNKVRIIAGIAFASFVILCVWACMFAHNEQKSYQNIPDENWQNRIGLSE